MLKTFFAGATLLLLSFSMAATEASINITQPTEYWSTVAAPTQPPSVYGTGFYQDSNYSWLYPYKDPSPGGVYRFFNAIVDSDGKIGVWSEPTTLTVKSGWRVQGGAWNQPVIEDSAGIAWKMEVVSINPDDDFASNPYHPGQQFYLYTGWQGQYLPNTIAPFSSHSPYLQTIETDAWRIFSLDKIPQGGRYTTVSPAPIVVASNIPNVTYQFAYARVTETGETALSPSVTFNPCAMPDPETSPAEVGLLRCTISEFHPQGTIGLHFYRREQITPAVPATEATPEMPATWGQWKRLQDAECYGTPHKDANGNYDKPDDWLWPIWKRVCLFTRYVDDAPVHQPAANPQSRLTKLHRLLRGDPVKDKEVLFEYLRKPDIITPITTSVELPLIGLTQVATGQVTVKQDYDSKYVNVNPVTGEPVSIKRVFVGDVVMQPGEAINIHCPVIDEWGNNDLGTTGGPDDQKFHRRVRASDFGRWNINQLPSQAGHTSYPVILINNAYSRWSGAKVIAAGGDGLVYSDYSGGQAFGNRFHECNFQAPMQTGGRVTAGIRIDHAMAPSHHASEQLFRDCTSNGGIAVIFGGNQAANLRVGRMHCNSYAPDPRGSVFYLENPNPISLEEGIYCDAYISSQMLLTGQRGVIFRAAVYHANVRTRDIWCDAGFVRFFECNNISTQLEMTGGKLNTRGVKPVLGLFSGHQSVKSTWAITNVQTQPNPGTQACRVINLNYRTSEPLLERTGLADVVLKEPSEATSQAMLSRYFPGTTLTPREEPGYRVNVDVPVMVTRERTPAEVTVAMQTMNPKIANLPEWGKVFLMKYWFKHTTEPGTAKVTSIFNSLTTGKKVAREDITHTMP